jgi:hypothetical protein
MRQFGQVWVLAFLVWLLGLTFFPTQSFGGVVGGTTGMACIGSDVGDTAKIGYDGSPVSHSVYDGRSILAPVQTVMRPESGCGILAQLGKLFAADTTTALSTYRVTQEGETFIRYESAIPESGGGQSGGNTIQIENQGTQGLTGQPGACIGSPLCHNATCLPRGGDQGFAQRQLSGVFVTRQAPFLNKQLNSEHLFQWSANGV